MFLCLCGAGLKSAGNLVVAPTDCYVECVCKGGTSCPYVDMISFSRETYLRVCYDHTKCKKSSAPQQIPNKSNTNVDFGLLKMKSGSKCYSNWTLTTLTESEICFA